MSNTLFRKGLVAAAIAGLAATAFAGTPAFAVAGVTLAPTTGTGTTVLAGDAFSLTATSSSEVPSSSYGTLKFKVTNVDGVAANAHTTGATDGTNSVNVGSTPITATAAASIVLAPVGNIANNVAVVIDGGTAATTAHFTVAAFLDANGNGAVDSGELVGTQTVTFLKAADVTATTSIDSIFTNAQTANATVVVTSAGWNTAQASAPRLSFTNGVAADIAVPTGTKATSYSSANSRYELSAALVTAALAKGTIVNAQAVLASTNVGTAASTTVADKAIATLVPTVTKSSTAQGTVTTNGINSGTLLRASGNADAYKVLTNGTFVVKALASDATPAPVAGRTVKFVVNTAATLSATAGAVVSITINGTTYNTAAALAAANTAGITAVTGADGNAVVTISTVGFTDGQGISVVASEEGISNTVYAVATDAAYTAVVSAGSSFQTAIGGTQNVSLIVADQFGTPIADGSDAIATSAVAGGNPVPATVVVPVVAGKATLALADTTGTATIGARTITWTLKVAKRDPITLNYPAGIAANTTVVVNTTANALDLAPATVSVTGAGAVTLATGTTNYTTNAAIEIQTGAFSANDARLGQTANPTLVANAVGHTYALALAGNVASVSSPTHTAAGIVGTNVTISKAGDLFYDAATGVYALDSITVQTTAAGAYAVTVYSHVAGTQTLAIAAGAATSTLAYTIAAPTAAAGADVIITAPATALPGTTITVSAKVVDKFGNTVGDVANAGGANPTYTLVLSGIGAGFTHNTLTAGTETNYVTFGASDVGTVNVTATWDVDGTATTNATVTKTAKIVVAAASAAKTSVAAGASQAQVGAAVDVTATATDAAGVPAAGVVVTFTVAGQGYLSTATATTNAKGVATVKLVSNVAGMNTVSAAANGTAVAATTAVTFGNADANLSFSSSKHTAIVNYEFAGNAKVVVSVNGVRVKTVYPADDLVGSIKVSLKKGKNKVTVSVAGVVTDVRTVTTK